MSVAAGVLFHTHFFVSHEFLLIFFCTGLRLKKSTRIMLQPVFVLDVKCTWVHLLEVSAVTRNKLNFHLKGAVHKAAVVDKVVANNMAKVSKAMASFEYRTTAIAAAVSL